MECAQRKFTGCPHRLYFSHFKCRLRLKNEIPWSYLLGRWKWNLAGSGARTSTEMAKGSVLCLFYFSLLLTAETLALLLFCFAVFHSPVALSCLAPSTINRTGTIQLHKASCRLAATVRVWKKKNQHFSILAAVHDARKHTRRWCHRVC